MTFTCQAIGDPVPTISWHFNDTMIDLLDTSKYYTTNSSNETVIMSSLTIMNLQSSDVGIYTCHAVNVHGDDQSSGMLTVNSK